jgi:hypothetical protein
MSSGIPAKRCSSVLGVVCSSLLSFRRLRLGRDLLLGIPRLLGEIGSAPLAVLAPAWSVCALRALVRVRCVAPVCVCGVHQPVCAALRRAVRAACTGSCVRRSGSHRDVPHMPHVEILPPPREVVSAVRAVCMIEVRAGMHTGTHLVSSVVFASNGRYYGNVLA